LKELEATLNSRIKRKRNANPDRLRSFFTPEEINRISERTIHLVGTNGKSSTAYYLSNILSKSGFSPGLFTSPHIKSLKERISIKGESNDFDEEVYKIIERLTFIEQEKDIHLGYFETLTFIAITLFVRFDLDYYILEAGIGGRLDPTSVGSGGTVILTSLSYDHTELLGDTLQEIASEKIRVSNRIVDFIIPKFDSDLLNFISKELDSSVKLHVVDENYITELNNIKSGLGHDSTRPLLNSEIMNKALALKASEVVLNKRVSFDDIGNKSLVGRYQVKSTKSKIIIYDMAHNPEAMSFLKDKIINDYSEKFSIFISFNKGKDYKAMIDILESVASKFYLPYERLWNNAVDSKELVGYLEQKAIPYECISEKSLIEKEDRILFTGSAYLIGKLVSL